MRAKVARSAEPSTTKASPSTQPGECRCPNPEQLDGHNPLPGSVAAMAARWVTVAVLPLIGGFMVFDGIRALTLGDYLTPSSGQYAGQLGPWSRSIEVVGIDPRSTPMKLGFVVIGTSHLVGAGALAASASALSVSLALIAAVLGIWYLPFGTLGSLVVMALITTTSLRPWG